MFFSLVNWEAQRANEVQHPQWSPPHGAQVSQALLRQRQYYEADLAADIVHNRLLYHKWVLRRRWHSAHAERRSTFTAKQQCWMMRHGSLPSHVAALM